MVRLRQARNIVSCRQENPPILPDALNAPNDDARFVYVNKALALSNSYIAINILRIDFTHDEVSPLYDEIRQYIRVTLNNNTAHPIRKELEARGWAFLLRDSWSDPQADQPGVTNNDD